MNKKGQLVALEFKLFIVGLVIGLALGIVGIIVLSKMGNLGFLLNMICPVQ